jgi:hypothetical protein
VWVIFTYVHPHPHPHAPTHSLSSKKELKSVFSVNFPHENIP